MAAHRKLMRVDPHKKRRKVAPLVAVMSVLVAGAAGGYALAGGRAPEKVDLASSTTGQAVGAGQQVTLTACLSSGQFTHVSTVSGAKCPARSTPFHWTAQPGLAAGQQHGTVTACLSSGRFTHVSTVSGAKCPARSTPFHWTARSGPAASQAGTVTACLTSGRLTRVLGTPSAKCPAWSVPFSWTAQPGTGSSASSTRSPSTVTTSKPTSAAPSTTITSPTSGPTTMSPSPAQTTTSPSASQTSSSPATWSWCSSDAYATFNVPGGPFDLYNNKWNSAANPGTQTLCGNSASDWQVTSTQRAGNSEVLTYPSVQLNYNGTKGYPLSKFTSMTSSYTENMNSVSGTDAEAAYDIWINNLNKEVMIWVDNHGQTPAGSKVATTTFSGATWDLYETSNRSYMAFVREGNSSSGTVNLSSALNYLQGRGDLSGSDVLWQVNFGWEICSTAGSAEKFSLSNYTLASSPSS
jgi:hypothetical protein